MGTSSCVRTTIYYGPWQCPQKWMDHCQTKCASEGRKLMGCMWLADIYPLVKDTALRRQQWKGARDSIPEGVGRGVRRMAKKWRRSLARAPHP